MHLLQDGGGGASLHAIVGLDRTASEVMALMSRSGSQQSQGLQPPPTVAVAAVGAPNAAAGTKGATAPLPVHSMSRFSVFGKNLTNATAPGPEVRAGHSGHQPNTSREGPRAV